MLMVWSWVTFLMALMLYVIRPFLPSQEPATADRNVNWPPSIARNMVVNLAMYRSPIGSGRTISHLTYVWLVCLVDRICYQEACSYRCFECVFVARS